MKISKKYSYYFILGLMFLCTILLRVYKLAQLPDILHIYEAGLGYNAWCLAHYGTDRYLNVHPFYAQNFEGGQSPLYTYLLVLLIKTIGCGNVSLWLTRLPAVIASLLLWGVGVKSISLIFHDRKFTIAAACFLAFCPYYIMSGGQRQRVAMGRAIVRNPKVFLMDEPLSNLDAKLRVQMRIEIAKLHQRLGTTIIYVTHDQTEAMTLGTRIVVMKDGVIQQVDTPQNLYEKPCNLFVAGFMGSPQMNFLDATVKVEGDIANLVIAGHSIPLPPAKSKKLIDGGYDGKVVTFGIRPEDVYDSEMYIETSPQSVFTSTIKVYELLGAEVYLYFDLDEFPMTARVDSRTTARPGDTVKFALDVEKIHVFDKETEQVITN